LAAFLLVCCRLTYFECLAKNAKISVWCEETP
jgi:hypothetical protein